MSRNPVANEFRTIFSIISVVVGILMILFGILCFTLSLVAVFESILLEGVWRLLFVASMSLGIFFTALPVRINQLARMMDPTEPSDRLDEESRELSEKVNKEPQPRSSDAVMEKERELEHE